MLGLLRQGAAAVLACAALVTVAHASPPEIYPLEKVHRGQTGYGMTTFAGDTPERFTFEVVSVVKNFLPKQDIVLVKSDDPKMQVSGFWRGMSGSPLYIDDKLLCAFSYGFAFNKLALGGCTPIEYMKKEGLDSFRRGVPVQGRGGAGPATITPAAATLEDWRRLTPKVDVNDAFAALGPLHKSWIASAPLPSALQRPGAVDGDVLQAAVPLSVAGFSAPAFAELSKIFGDSDLVPMRAGGAGGAPTEGGPQKFVMGGAISVELIRGDMSAAATGTVSYVDGNKILAFGHPMFQTGETYAPVATASVHTVIPSAQSAFVMATAMKEIGSLVQDRQAAIMADTNLRSPTIPLDITISTVAGGHKEGGAFKVELIDNKFLDARPRRGRGRQRDRVLHPGSRRRHGEGRLDDLDQGRRADQVHRLHVCERRRGLDHGRRARPARARAADVEPVRAASHRGMDIKVELTFGANFGEVKEMSVPTADLIAGERNLLHVRMSTWDGKDVFEDVPLDVPANAAGSIVQVELTSGDSAKLDAAPPVDLPSLLTVIRRLLPGDVWAASMYPADEGVAVEGKLVRDLPASALDKLHPQSHTQRAQPYKPIARTLSPSRRVIAGGTSILARVRARP